MQPGSVPPIGGPVRPDGRPEGTTAAPQRTDLMMPERAITAMRWTADVRSYRRLAKQIAEEAVAPTASVPAAAPDTAKPTAAERRSQDAYTRRQARYEEAARLKAASVSLQRNAALVRA